MCHGRTIKLLPNASSLQKHDHSWLMRFYFSYYLIYLCFLFEGWGSDLLFLCPLANWLCQQKQHLRRQRAFRTVSSEESLHTSFPDGHLSTIRSQNGTSKSTISDLIAFKQVGYVLITFRTGFHSKTCLKGS